MLLDNRLDAAMIEAPIDHRDLTGEPFPATSWLLILLPGHRCCKKTASPLADVAACDLLLREKEVRGAPFWIRSEAHWPDRVPLWGAPAPRRSCAQSLPAWKRASFKRAPSATRRSPAPATSSGTETNTFLPSLKLLIRADEGRIKLIEDIRFSQRKGKPIQKAPLFRGRPIENRFTS